MNLQVFQKKTIIHLTPEEAELFKWFRQYQSIFERILNEQGAGSLTIHFNAKKEIRKREYHFFENGRKSVENSKT
jgi:hypothetical protein